MPVHIGPKRRRKLPLDTGWYDLEPALTSAPLDEADCPALPTTPAPSQPNHRAENAPGKVDRRQRLRKDSVLDDVQLLNADYPDMEEIEQPAGWSKQRKLTNIEWDDGDDFRDAASEYFQFPDADPTKLDRLPKLRKISRRDLNLDNEESFSATDEIPQASLDNLTPSRFDEIDLLTMRANPQLSKPKTGGKRKHLRVAIYARFSTSRQKQRSIVHQVEICEHYYRERLGAQTHRLFADKGRSGANMDREAIQALIVAIKNGEIDVVVFYAFDRVSRELFSALRFFETADEHGVELHCARSGRRYTKQDAAREAMEAENDLKLRAERTMDGLNELVKMSGLPWGWNFGHQPTRRAGFPVLHKVHRKTVRRIFLLIVTMTSTDIAKLLTEQGVITPHGDTFWNSSTVAFIARNVIYTGRIRYRVTIIRKNKTIIDPTTGAEKRPSKKYSVKSNEEWRWIVGRNENLRIVTDEEFKAARKAVLSRTTREPSATRQKDTEGKALPLFGDPGCDCEIPSSLEQRYYMVRATEGDCSHRYTCSLQGRNGSCRSKNGTSMRADIVENALFEMIVPHLAQQLSPAFEESFLRRLKLVTQDLETKRATIADRIAQLRRDEDVLLEDFLNRTFSKTAVASKTQAITVELDKLNRDYAKLPRISVDAIDFDGTRERLEDGFDLIRRRLPFIPSNDEEKDFVRAIRRAVLKIELCHSGRTQGRIGLKVDVQIERIFLTDVQLAACPFKPVTLETEFIVPLFYYPGAMDRMSELAADGLHALTDEQWALLSPKLPDLTRTDHNGQRPTDTRSILNCLLFLLRTDMPFSAIPSFFGEKSQVYNAMLRLISAGGIETLRAVFSEHDPQFLVGLDLEKLANRRRAVEYSRVARVAIRPTETAARYAEEKRFALSDKQWLAIQHLFDPRIERPTGREARPISSRVAMEGIFVKLATHCAWSKMPPSLGGKHLVGVAAMIAYYGAWSGSLEILAREFPALIESIDTTPMDRMPRSLEIKRRERQFSSKTATNLEATTI